jgi:hypothetical protein
VGDRSRGRFATPAGFSLHDCSPYPHVHVRRESLGCVPGSKGRFLSPRAKPSRNDSPLPHRSVRQVYAIDATRVALYGAELAAAAGLVSGPPGFEAAVERRVSTFRPHAEVWKSRRRTAMEKWRIVRFGFGTW